MERERSTWNMSEDKVGTYVGEEVREDLDRPRGSLRGPLILAKFVVDALEKKQQVCHSMIIYIT